MADPPKPSGIASIPSRFDKDRLYVRADDPWILFYATLLGMTGLKEDTERDAAEKLISTDIHRLYAEEAWKLVKEEGKRELANRIAKLLVSPKTESRLEKAVMRIIDAFVVQHLANYGEALVDKLGAKVLKVFEEQIEANVRRAAEAAIEAALRDLKARLAGSQ